MMPTFTSGRKRQPLQGEIWFVKMHTDPPGKGQRPVIIVSTNARNQHERALTVLVVPLTTSIHKEMPTHLYLPPGETGLQDQSAAQAENICVVSKDKLLEPNQGLRMLSKHRIVQIADKVRIAMGA